MNAHSLELLEYGRVKEDISAFCRAQEGREAFMLIAPETDADSIDKKKELGSAWTDLRTRGFDLEAQSWPPIAHILPSLKTEGAVLTQEDLHALNRFVSAELATARGIKRCCESAASALTESRIAVMTSAADDLPDLKDARELLSAILDENGDLRDLPELRDIRARITRLRERIERTMRGFFTDEAYKPFLQSLAPAFRNGRAALPVKARWRSKIRGIVRDVSQSGQTAYIEPETIIEQNNELALAQAELNEAIKKIFKRVSDALRPMREIVEQARKQMLFLDCVQAASAWGVKLQCVYARRGSYIDLEKARHPLLYENAVPIDLRLSEDVKALIITGPNTGGKTVSLKTAGLLALMNQSGFPIPAASGSALPYFSGVYADLGDKQSLEQSLSTFSAHMKNIKSVCETADERSLILLDELGGGTDPDEGAAIAMALLDYFLESGALILSTTHCGALKKYGYAKPRCMNASMDFDEVNLKPRYRLTLGVPGESRALTAAVACGLDKRVTDAAFKYLNGERTDADSLAKELSEREQNLTRRENEYTAARKQLDESLRLAAAREAEIKAKELESRSDACKRLDAFIDESRRKLENLVRELREGEITREKTLAVKNFTAELAGDLSAEKKEIDAEKAALKSAAENAPDKNETQSGRREKTNFLPGNKVRIISENRTATLVRKKQNGSWIAETGALRLTISESNMELIGSAQTPRRPSIETDLKSSENRAVFELDLRGMRRNDALEALAKQLDRAVLQGMQTFAVIHGAGDGVLRQATHEYLSANPLVSEYYFSAPREGGFGKTWVKLK